MPDDEKKSPRVVVKPDSSWSAFARLLERAKEWPVK